MPRVDQTFGSAVARVLDEHRLGKRQQTVRTGIDHVTVGKMLDGIIPSLETVEKFARGFGLDVNEWRLLAGFPKVESGGLTQKLDAMLGRHQSPAQWLDGAIDAAIAKYEPRGYALPDPDATRYGHGGEFDTEDDALRAFAHWLETLALDNPGKPEPEELAELREELGASE